MKGRRRRSFFDEIFGDVEEEFERFEKLFQESEVGDYGYSINVIEEFGKTKVYVKAGRNVDVSELKKTLSERYPGAEIVVEGGKPIIEEVKVDKETTGKGKTYRIPVEGSKTDEKRKKPPIEPL